MKVLRALFPLAAVLFLHDVISQQLSNYTPENSPLKYTVTKRRTQVGRWITEIHFKHDETQDGPYEVQVEQITSDICSQENFVDVIVSVSDVGYYKFHSSAVIWDQARKTCAIEGGHLVIINSDAELSIVINIMEKNKAALLHDAILLGFHDRFVEGEFTTLFGIPLNSTGYYKWDVGQPDNNKGNENCGSLRRNGLMNDIGCSVILPFVCEFKRKKIGCDMLKK